MEGGGVKFTIQKYLRNWRGRYEYFYYFQIQLTCIQLNF